MKPESTLPSKSLKGGAPLRNMNRLRTGKRSRQSLVLGTPPKGMTYAVDGAREVMQEVRRAVVDARGQTTVYDESLILEIGEWETHRRLCWRLLRVEAGKLTVDQQMTIRRDAAKAATERSRCLKLLDLSSHHDPLGMLMRQFTHPRPATTETQDDPTDVPTPADSPAAVIDTTAEGGHD